MLWGYTSGLPGGMLQYVDEHVLGPEVHFLSHVGSGLLNKTNEGDVTKHTLVASLPWGQRSTRRHRGGSELLPELQVAPLGIKKVPFPSKGACESSVRLTHRGSQENRTSTSPNSKTWN